MPSAWEFTFDHAQRRFSRLRIGVAMAGNELLDRALSSDVYQEPVSLGIILKPIAEYPGWNTSNSGVFVKLSRADFGSPAFVFESEQSGNSARKFLTGPVNQTIQTTATWATNTGFVFEFLNYSNGANGIALEFGWSNSTSISQDTAVRVYADLSCEVWRKGAVVQQGRIYFFLLSVRGKRAKWGAKASSTKPCGDQK